MDIGQQRKQAHAYLDQLPPAQLRAVRSLLESMINPLSLPLGTELAEDTTWTSEQAESLGVSLEWLKQERSVPLEKVLGDFGLSLDDFERLERAHNAARAHGSGS